MNVTTAPACGILIRTVLILETGRKVTHGQPDKPTIVHTDNLTE